MILPSKLAHAAKNLKDQDLFDYLATIHQARWSIRSIACALNISPTTATKYIEKGKVNYEALDKVPIPHEFEPVAELPINDYHRLRSLSQLARKSASATPSPRARQASQDLNIYLRILKDEGYALKYIAEACATSKTAVSQRLKKTDPGQFTREDLP